MINDTIRAAVDKATAAAANMIGGADEYVGRRQDGYVDDAHARRRTTIVDDAPVSVGSGRAMVTADTLSDATYLADVAHVKSLVKATFAVIAVGDRFAVVPAWTAPTSAVLYRTGH